MKKNKLKLVKLFGVFLALSLLLPIVASAQYYPGTPVTPGGGVGITDQCEARFLTAKGATLQLVLCRISVLINSAIPVLVALGVAYFIFGVISYAIAKDDEGKTAGRSAMIMGLIALLVIVSIWGLVNVIKNTFGLDKVVDYVDIPCVSSPGSGC